ncbi:hypothetical protein [Rhodococcus sp. 14-2470-1a]|uniref:hypothetical protein n=1 Tax=Rhodococcus sp. 14-2470-1a TaxID=2023150 RepID=UPI000B9A372B|nr:hypothetical protein [Rhodococcus sp. 14-2470-1a]OZF41925.1 hypothetical protein CH292_27350 [Rhodococcus sp. 14-2470-1a]
MPGFLAGLGPAKVRALVYVLAFFVFGALAIAGVMTLDDADRWLGLAGGALGMSTMGLSLKNLQKAPDVIDEAGRPVAAPAPDPGVRELLEAVEGLVRRVELAGGSVAAPAQDGVPAVVVDGAPYAGGDVLRERLALEARASQ